MGQVSKKQGKKGRKIGRNARKPSHKRYVAERRWIKNKARRIARMMRRHPNYPMPANLPDETKNWVRIYLKK